MYDGGLAAGAFEFLSALRNQKVICAGNSSGSVWAVYFANHGFTPQSIGAISQYASQLDVSKVRQNESLTYKLDKSIKGEKADLQPTVLLPALAVALDVNDWSDCQSVYDVARKSHWRPNFPFLIVAANLDVLGDATEAALPIVDRVMDYDTYEVSWTDRAFARYAGDRRTFERTQPLVNWTGEKRIGKAATYFCDAATYKILSQLPPQERMADLRLVETPSDALMAMLASTAEPTFFAPVEECDFGKLDVGFGRGQPGNIRRRIYCGGFIIPVVAQDLRRALPQAHVVGTQWAGLNKLARAYFEKRWGLDLELMHFKSNWWLDAELRPAPSVQRLVASRVLNEVEEYSIGLDTARRQLASGGQPPAYVIPGKYARSQPPLLTNRGVKSLVRVSD